MSSERVPAAAMVLACSSARFIPGLSNADPGVIDDNEAVRLTALLGDQNDPWNEEAWETATKLSTASILAAGEKLDIMNRPGSPQDRLSAIRDEIVTIIGYWAKGRGLDADRAFEMAFC